MAVSPNPLYIASGCGRTPLLPPPSKAPPTPLVNPSKQTISTFVNYLWKNGPVVSWRVNGASTIEGLAWIIPTLNGLVWGWTVEWETQLTGPASALCMRGLMCCKFTLKYKERLRSLRVDRVKFPKKLSAALQNE